MAVDSTNFFAKMIGLGVIGVLEGSHATIFKKIKSIEPNWNQIRFFEIVSYLAFPLIEIFKAF